MRMSRRRRTAHQHGPQRASRAAVSLCFGVLVTAGATFAGAATPPAAFDQLARRRDNVARPPHSSRRFCSLRVRGCLHAHASVPDSVITRAAAALETTLDTLSLFDLPPPLPDGSRGGGPAFDVYLTPQAVGAASYSDGPPLPHDLDRRSAFGVVSTAAGPACAIASRISRAVAQGAALGLDSGAHEATLSMYGSYVAHLLHPCPLIEAAAIDTVQRRPWRSLLSTSRTQFSGTFLFPAFLDADWGRGVPATVATGLIAASVQHTNIHDMWWHNEPDVFDTLRTNMQLRHLTLADLFTSYAVNRSFVGDRSDGLHIPDTEQFGHFGNIVFEWAIDFTSLPRQLAPLHPVEPTGASYIWLDLAGAKPESEVVLDIHWEDTFVMQWAAVRIDPQGRELGRLLSGGVFGHNHAQLSVANLTGAAAIVVVGTNLGNDDRSKPYDPEDGPPRPVGYTITIHAR